jgi:ribosomal protein L24E
MGSRRKWVRVRTRITALGAGRLVLVVMMVAAIVMLGLPAATGGAAIATDAGFEQASTSGQPARRFSPWEPAANLESISGTSSELNTEFLEGCPMLSRDGLHLYIASNRPAGAGNLDIWVAGRDNADAPFGAPVNMGAPINSASRDFCPSPLRDGHGFMFVSDRPGGCGGSDIYVTRNHPVFGWADPVNLGCEVNSPVDEQGPVLVYAGPGAPTLYFSSARTGVSDLYMSPMVGDWQFGPPVIVPGVNSSDAAEGQPYVSRDGRELFFFSTRLGGLGGSDIWSANRNSIADPWSAPFNLGANVNTAAAESRPSLSWDGKTLLFGSTRPGVEGASDIFYATRGR